MSKDWTRDFGDAGTPDAQRTMKQEGQAEGACLVVLWAEHPDETLLAERMNNGIVHSSAQGHGGGTQRELTPRGGGGGSGTKVAKKLLSFNQIITKLYHM